MMIPTLHLNGTSRAELIKQLTDASHALRIAIDALGDASPHGRDYYPQGPDAFRQAHDEHIARFGRLFDVKTEIDALAMKIHDAPGRR
jgi:hypothetical protein